MSKKISLYIYIAIGGLLATVAVIGMSFRDPAKGEGAVEVKQDGKLQYKWYTPDLPTQINFAGERVPLEKWEVREQFDRELLSNYYQHGSTLYILKLSTRYFSIIEQRLKANGIPDDFKYLCVAESALRNQISPANAVGFWQFVPSAAQRYGLEVNDEVDERYNLEKSTDAACRYFLESRTKFGSWTAAAASYNCGQAGYSKFISFQQTNDYYNTMLPDETMRYVFRIITFKYIMTNAEKLGFILYPSDQYQPIKTRTITVDSTIYDLAQFAIDNGSNYKMLKILNPWLRDHTLTVRAGKTYEIKLPAS
jgi:membrane-bound lytic murein transglycosylase D